MQTGTEILLARMAEYPEEFIEGNISKWSRVMHMGYECLPDEDKAALKDAHDKAKIAHFNGEVLATLAGEREMGTEANPFSINKPPNTMRTMEMQQQIMENEMMQQQSRIMNDRARNAYPSGGVIGSGGKGIWSNLF